MRSSNPPLTARRVFGRARAKDIHLATMSVLSARLQQRVRSYLEQGYKPRVHPSASFLVLGESDIRLTRAGGTDPPQPGMSTFGT